MLQTEFVRSLNSNYERILLDKKPEEKKYQYCILNRGGIKGLLPSSLRYINGLAYLYYDITSKQNVAQLYERRPMNRKWVQDFVWGLKQIQVELSRFLLDAQNILWYPQQIFQDLESNVFNFLYVPYYREENSFQKLLEFMVEHIDYEDEGLVECVYKMYEQYEKSGEVYLQEQIYEDVKMLEKETNSQSAECKTDMGMPTNAEEPERAYQEGGRNRKNENPSKSPVQVEMTEAVNKQEKKGFFSLLEGRKKKERESRESYQQAMEQSMSGYAVAEETHYDEEWGRTIYMEEASVSKPKVYGLYTIKGILVETLERTALTIGKKVGEVDLVLEDASVSRMHARIIKEQEEFFLEDLNSTNGTFKNGLRMQPYEKRKLEEGDEIKLGKTVFIFR